MAKRKAMRRKETRRRRHRSRQMASPSPTVPLATRRVLARPLREVVIMPRFASRPLLQPALPSPPTCPTRQSLPWLNLPSLFFPACCLLNNFIKLAQFHPLGVYSNYVECWPFEGLLCKYYCVFGFHSCMLFILRLFPLPPSPSGKASTRAFLDWSEVNGSRPAGYSGSRSVVGEKPAFVILVR